MRVSILGNSDTVGARLAPGEPTWPTILQERLSEALAEPVIFDNWRWAVYRPGAVEYATVLVEEARPDVVVITLASFWCAFSTVQIRVRQRFGVRVARAYQRLERMTSRATEGEDRPGKGTNSVGRRAARRLIGTGTLMSVGAFIETYGALIRRLSQDEHLQLVVLGDHHFTSDVRRAMPMLDAAIHQIESAVRPLVQERHLVWGDLEEALQTGGRRDEMILGDGIHMTAEAHRRVADALENVLRSALTDLPLRPVDHADAI